MEIRAQLNRQRVKHIISSYQLEGNDKAAFEHDLDLLLHAYPLPLVELALVETLVDCWLQVPLLRGCKFLTKVHDQLQAWEKQALLPGDLAPSQHASTISPEQFQQITGLDPTPIFGSSTLQTASPVRSPGSSF